MSLNGVIHGKSPTAAFPLHHLADDASTAILLVPRINKGDTESGTHDRKQYGANCQLLWPVPHRSKQPEAPASGYAT
jgi:hypothetical protein